MTALSGRLCVWDKGKWGRRCGLCGGGGGGERLG